MTPLRRLVAPLLTVAVAVAGLLAVTAPGAVAHAVLVSTTPSDGASIATLPDEAVITFNENVTTPAYVVVEAPDGTKATRGAARVEKHSVHAALKDLGIRGRYRLSWRVVSADGHPVTGSVYFDVTQGRTVDSTRDDSHDSDTSFVSEHRAHLLWGGAAVVAALALLLWPRRREDEES